MHQKMYLDIIKESPGYTKIFFILCYAPIVVYLPKSSKKKKKNSKNSRSDYN